MTLTEILKKAKKIVFFGGAGVSTGSGIPDFRGTGGLYTEVHHYDAPPEEILSGRYLRKYPQKFYEYYKNEMLYPNAKPNDAHLALAKLEQMGKLTAVITQNIDGLHQMAGSQNVIELHGSVLRNYCVSCGEKYPLSFVTAAEDVPRCEKCGGIVRPDVVLYGEGLIQKDIIRAAQLIADADLLIVGGTSLTVYPAAGLVRYFNGDKFVILNKSETPYDEYADLIIRDSIADVLGNAVREMN